MSWSNCVEEREEEKWKRGREEALWKSGPLGARKVHAEKGFQSVRENLCRPSGTRLVFPLYPGLTSWAKLFGRSAAGVWSFLLRHSPKMQF